MNHTSEEVRAEAASFARVFNERVASMLTAYADSIERAQAGVTDEVVKRAYAAMDATFQREYPAQLDEAEKALALAGVRAALLAVWPVAAEPAQAVPVAQLRLRLDRWDVVGIRSEIEKLHLPTGEYPLFTHPPAQAAQVDMHPKHGDMHDGCGGYWCDYVQAEYKKPGPITLYESNIVRYVKLGLMCDKCGVERPTAEPVAQPADSGQPFTPDWTGYRQGVQDGRSEALAAQGQSPASPAGVPEEKTEMDYEYDEEGLIDTYCTGHMDGWNDCRKTMLAAAPSAPEGES